MNTRPAPARRRARPLGTVSALDALRIERALAQRTRYRYVQPSVMAQSEGKGWVIASPNCSRNIDPEGGVIAIAWLEPLPGEPARWRLHRREHAQAGWVLHADGLPLQQALAAVCSDPLGVWWP